MFEIKPHSDLSMGSSSSNNENKCFFKKRSRFFSKPFVYIEYGLSFSDSPLSPA